MRPNFDLLKEAYAIIDGIPEERINLDFFGNWSALKHGPNGCDTVACILGWIGMHPKFVALGINTRARNLIESSERVFGINDKQWNNLFSWRRLSEYDYKAPSKLAELTDKQLWLHRVQCFFIEHGEVL